MHPHACSLARSLIHSTLLKKPLARTERYNSSKNFFSATNYFFSLCVLLRRWNHVKLKENLSGVIGRFWSLCDFLGNDFQQLSIKHQAIKRCFMLNPTDIFTTRNKFHFRLSQSTLTKILFLFFPSLFCFRVFIG